MKLLGVNERKGVFENDHGEKVNWRSYDLVFGDSFKTEIVKCNADQIDRCLNGHNPSSYIGQDLEIYQNLFNKTYVIQKAK